MRQVLIRLRRLSGAAILGLSGVMVIAQAAPVPTARPAPSAAHEDPALAPAPDIAERAYIAARLYQTVTTYFAHDEALPAGYDFDSQYRRFLAEAFSARTRLSFDRAAMRLLGSLQNGHTGFTDTATRSQPSLPFRLRHLDGRWLVIGSQLPAGAGLDPGGEIVTLDGAPFQAWIDANTAFTRRSNEAESEMSLMESAFLWPEHFVLGLADGHTVRVDRMTPLAAPWRGASLPADVRVTEPGPGIVRIEIPGFDRPAEEAAALDAVRHHLDARAILFDVRGNGGGNTPDHLLAALIETPYRDMISVTPLHIGTLDAWAALGTTILPNAMVQNGGELIQPDHPLYHGRVLVLTDGACASSCEDFVLAIHVSHRGPILGEATYGSTGQPFTVSFPEVGMSLRVSTRREYLPGFVPFEGVGVQPDIAIPLTPTMLRSSRDEVLDRALDIARRGRP